VRPIRGIRTLRLLVQPARPVHEGRTGGSEHDLSLRSGEAIGRRGRDQFGCHAAPTVGCTRAPSPAAGCRSVWYRRGTSREGPVGPVLAEAIVASPVVMRRGSRCETI
jgi:hypothetical protein